MKIRFTFLGTLYWGTLTFYKLVEFVQIFPRISVHNRQHLINTTRHIFVFKAINKPNAQKQ